MTTTTPNRTEPTAAETPDTEPASFSGSGQSAMRAIVQRSYGSADNLELETMEHPTIGPNEVLIEVHAAGVDQGTAHLMTGTPYVVRLAGLGLTKPKQPIMGFDVAGQVVAIGSAVNRFAVGDDVFGIARGSFADYAAADENKLARKPRNVTVAQAAVSTVSGITALQALIDFGKIQPGQHVLILGASGGVGTYTVQLAKALGAEVTAVDSTAKLDLALSLGADHVVDYTSDDFADNGKTYDLIIDAGGRNSLSRLRRVLTPHGTLVIVGGEGGNRLTGGVGRQLRAVLLSPFVKQRLTMFITKEHHSSIEQLGQFIESGDVVPSIGQRFTLEDTAEAFRQMEAGTIQGNSVVIIHNRATDTDSLGKPKTQKPARIPRS
jgi:NADPH:quinone reductase-like Zn-dependent oxidoreductase